MTNGFSSRKNVPTHKKTRRAAMRDARIVAARTAAEERQTEHDKLSTKEKLARLDLTFGVGLGAARERAKLNTLLAQEAQKASEKVVAVQTAEGTVVEEKAQKKVSRGKKAK